MTVCVGMLRGQTKYLAGGNPGARVLTDAAADPDEIAQHHQSTGFLDQQLLPQNSFIELPSRLAEVPPGITGKSGFSGCPEQQHGDQTLAGALHIV